MSGPLARGACPSLDAPMRTGDGWLARLGFTDGLTGGQLAGLAEVAARLGNAVMEVTSRGSLQLRGLADGAPLAEAVAPLGLPLAVGLPVVVSPLAGRDPSEVADPRPLAVALRGFGGTLPPKVTALVDGGGLSLDAVPADVRLRADEAGWHVGVGGATGAAARWLGVFDAAEAVERALGLLARMSRDMRRGRDLEGVPGASLPSRRPAAEMVARLALRDGVARGVGFAFGSATSDAVAELALAAGDARLFPAPHRALVAVGLEREAAFVAAAGRLGFVTAADDARLAIAACPGAPACSSGRLRTRTIGQRIAAERPDLLRGVRLHLSGCAKRCAQPAGPAVTLVAEAGTARVTGDGRAVPGALDTYLLEALAW